MGYAVIAVNHFRQPLLRSQWGARGRSTRYLGLADPEARPLAIATQHAVEFVGMPEARIPLAHATAYMCRASKSREAYE